MKKYTLVLLAAACLLTAGCGEDKKNNPAPTSTPSPPADPYAFKADAGKLSISQTGQSTYTLANLERSFHPYDTYTNITYRGKTPAGTGVVVLFRLGLDSRSGKGPWNGTSTISFTPASYQIQNNGLNDLRGSCILGTPTMPLEGTFSAGTVSGTLK